MLDGQGIFGHFSAENRAIDLVSCDDLALD